MLFKDYLKFKMHKYLIVINNKVIKVFVANLFHLSEELSDVELKFDWFFNVLNT